jgi:hypothetical protein
MFSAELLLCLVFVQKSDFQEKSWKIPQSSYFTRRHTKPEYETERSHEGLTRPGGAGQARPRQRLVWPPRPSPRLYLPPTYTLWPENIGGLVFFPNRVSLHRHHQKPRFGTRNSVLAPCRDRDLEEIDFYARIYSCRQCWSSKCRGL